MPFDCYIIFGEFCNGVRSVKVTVSHLLTTRFEHGTEAKRIQCILMYISDQSSTAVIGSLCCICIYIMSPRAQRRQKTNDERKQL